MLDQRQRRARDTRTPVEQAFGYAPKYGKNCQWVIVSNYKEIRLYRSNDMTEYQVFFLENLQCLIILLKLRVDVRTVRDRS